MFITTASFVYSAWYNNSECFFFANDATSSHLFDTMLTLQNFNCGNCCNAVCVQLLLLLVGMDELCLQISRRLQHEQLADSEVSQLMQESFDGRKVWIQTIMPPISTVFRKFPPLKDILSSHVSACFIFALNAVCTVLDS